MQALWSTLHNHDDTVATVAFRVLGKFGGSNRKMLSTPQPVSIGPRHIAITMVIVGIAMVTYHVTLVTPVSHPRLCNRSYGYRCCHGYSPPPS